MNKEDIKVNFKDNILCSKLNANRRIKQRAQIISELNVITVLSSGPFQ